MTRVQSSTSCRFAALVASTAVLALALAPVAVAEPARAITLAAGTTEYDLSGTGNTGVFGLTLDLPLGSTFVVEPGLRYLRYGSQGEERTSVVMPEVGLQAQLQWGTVRPYLGVGAGAAFQNTDHDSSDLTAHVALGARIPLAEKALLRLEGRVRAIDPFVGTTADLTAGLGWRF